MTARVNVAINYEKNKVEVFRFTEVDGVMATEKEIDFASQAMTMLQKLDINDEKVKIEHVIDLGATIEFTEDNGVVSISVLNNGRHNVVGGSLSLTYRIATSVVHEMKQYFSDENVIYDDEDYDDYDDLAF